MPDPNFVILYVEDPAASAAFYTEVLGRPPVEASPTFAMFALSGGLMLGLWSRDHVMPAVTAAPGGNELAVAVADQDAVQGLYAQWCERRFVIAQAPAAMDFGYTFLALDPDGHRLRVFAPAAP